MEKAEKKIALIDEQIEVIINKQKIAKETWTALKINLLADGFTNADLKQLKDTYISRSLAKELSNLRQQRNYYTKNKPYYQKYYQAHRDQQLAKYHEKKKAARKD